ncbi:MAG: ArnT family glycosyltransferase, partial [Desulfatiglandales bacterium]
DPFYLAHSRFLHHDALVTSFMTLALLSFMVCTEEGMSRPYLIFSGSMAGLAFLSKSPSLFLVPFVGLVVSLGYLSQAKGLSKEKWGIGLHWIAALVVWVLIASFVFVILWPAMWVDPAGAINRIVTKIEESGPASPDTLEHAFLEGKVTPALFYPAVFLFRITPLTLVGLMAAVYSCTEKWPERKNKVLILLLVYSLGFTLLLTSGGKKSGRYSLPAFPVLDVVAAVGLLRAIKSARQKKRWPFTVPCVLALVLQAGFSLPHHPYYLTYYNPLFGGGWSAVKVLRVSEGEGLDQVVRYLNRKENAERLTVSTGWDDALAPFFRGQTCRLYGSTDQNVLLWSTADYVVLDINHIQTHLHDEPLVGYLLSLEPEYVVNLKGIDTIGFTRFQRTFPLIWCLPSTSSELNFQMKAFSFWAMM